ncbi:MAG: alpha/beta hydrolase [Ktedonobacteraceae bacterium]
MGVLERLGQVSRRLFGRNNGIRMQYGPNAFQYGELYLAQGKPSKTPIVLLIHGGFWRAAYGLALMRPLARDLVQHGITAWNIEYRRVGNNNGGWPETMLDVALATDYIRTLASQYAIDEERVVTVGHSAGGHLALWVAARHRITAGELLAQNPMKITGVVSLAGCADLEYVAQLGLGRDAVVELLGGEPQTVPERYAAASPAALLPIGVPQVLIHGTRDNNVPFDVSQFYTRKALDAGDDVTLIELPGADHFVVIDATSESWAITLKEVQRLLGYM